MLASLKTVAAFIKHSREVRCGEVLDAVDYQIFIMFNDDVEATSNHRRQWEHASGENLCVVESTQ